MKALMSDALATGHIEVAAEFVERALPTLLDPQFRHDLRHRLVETALALNDGLEVVFECAIDNLASAIDNQRETEAVRRLIDAGCDSDVVRRGLQRLWVECGRETLGEILMLRLAQTYVDAGLRDSVVEIAPWMSHFKAGRSFLLAALPTLELDAIWLEVAGVAFDELDERSQIDLLARAIDCAERLQNVNALASWCLRRAERDGLSMRDVSAFSSLAQFGCVPRKC